MPVLKPLVALMATACAVLAPAARAADDAATLRQELETLKSDYEARVAALESRIAQLESAAPAAETVAATPPRPRPPAALRPSIPQFPWYSPAITPTRPAIPRTGAWPASCRRAARSGPASAASTWANPRLTLAASVDPYFAAQMSVAITGEDEIEVEEA